MRQRFKNLIVSLKTRYLTQDDVMWVKVPMTCRTKTEKLKLIRFYKNYGQTAAFMAGIDMAKGKIIIPIDSDLQNDPQDIPALLAKLNEGYDLVSGWRKDRQDSFLRSFMSMVANNAISLLWGMTAGFPVAAPKLSSTSSPSKQSAPSLCCRQPIRLRAVSTI